MTIEKRMNEFIKLLKDIERNPWKYTTEELSKKYKKAWDLFNQYSTEKSPMYDEKDKKVKLNGFGLVILSRLLGEKQNKEMQIKQVQLQRIICLTAIVLAVCTYFEFRSSNYSFNQRDLISFLDALLVLVLLASLIIIFILFTKTFINK